MVQNRHQGKPLEIHVDQTSQGSKTEDAATPLVRGLDSSWSFGADYTVVPVIDWRLLAQTDAPLNEAGVAERLRLRKALTDVGFFQLVNHPVSEEVRCNLLNQTKNVFSLPLEEKQQHGLNTEAGKGVRGYFGTFSENLDQLEAESDYTGDCKEGWDLGIEHPIPQLDIIPSKDSIFHSPNLWPDFEGDEKAALLFRQACDNALVEYCTLSLQLIRIICEVLGVKSPFANTCFKHPCCNLRILHYIFGDSTARIAKNEDHGLLERHVACGAHTDYGCFTLLTQDETGGLEVLDEKGKWHPVPYIPGAFVVNIGDMLHELTQRRALSTVHRVTYLAGKDASGSTVTTARDRYSLPFFFNPSPATLLTPFEMDATLWPEKSSEWSTIEEPLTCEQHLTRRYVKAFRQDSPDTK